MASSSTFPAESQLSSWTWEENKKFEMGIVEFPENTPNRWENIANSLRGKSAKEVEEHYKKLVDDVMAIDSGLYEISLSETENANKIIQVQNSVGVQEKREYTTTGKPWTKDEHGLFLMGLKEYGRGDWKSISRNLVKTRSPSQVASHAQKFFIRLEKNGGKKRKRSIHDTLIDENTSSNPDLVPDPGHTSNATQPSI